jgi:hypothetical protein
MQSMDDDHYEDGRGDRDDDRGEAGGDEHH